MHAPNRGLSRLSERNVESVEAEIAQEKASALSRMSTRFQEAMARLEAFDPEGAEAGEREKLVAAAGEALWYYVVQREAIGLRDVGMVLREFRVPREVYVRMGMGQRRG